MTLEETATKLLLLLNQARATRPNQPEMTGPVIGEITGLPPHEINDAAAILEQSGYIDWVRYLGTEPYDFDRVWVTPLGRYEAERAQSVLAQPLDLKGVAKKAGEPGSGGNVSLPPTPIGSPYGFNDEDWELIASHKAATDHLTVVMGYQFVSAHYDSDALQKNMAAHLQRAVDAYNKQAGAFHASLDFRALAAGYGEHLFNEIARDIISADIAIFETSDLNPNVMLELGVALTWGVRVLPIKVTTQPKPPSDISGQTWADYENHGERFLDPDHDKKLIRMVERAMRKKGRR